MSIVIEIVASKVSERARADLVAGIRQIVKAQGLELAETETLTPGMGTLDALANVGTSRRVGMNKSHGRARVRVYVSE